MLFARHAGLLFPDLFAPQRTALYPREDQLKERILYWQTQRTVCQPLRKLRPATCPLLFLRTAPTSRCATFFFFNVPSADQVQAEELKATHVVQSHRGLIERRFALLKNWEVLQGGA
jgi:hypothetical protein